ncbi:MAG: GNAT family N-acetyltransferase [Spirochaetes bacterium]|nr:GNAT family N-acetyltransferase [Spirochaetota bacterium]
MRIREYRDTEEFSRLWKRSWPAKSIFDLWEVRDCFNRAFNRPSVFFTAEQNDQIMGLLPLSWIDEQQCFAVFPGETWQGKTWLEQNKIPAADISIRNDLLACIPDRAHLRYLGLDSIDTDVPTAEVDETGYIFIPGTYNYSFQPYMEQLSGKFRKNYLSESSRLVKDGLTFRHDRISDIEHLFRMNIESFGESSYFAESRFRHGFENLISWLMDNNMLRITTVIIGDKVAAVDIGALWEQHYTVLAGGTNPEFMGVAKIINFHHLEWSCSQRLKTVDFLCGDFGWKKRLNLTPRPLYQIHIRPGESLEPKSMHASMENSFV